MSLRFRASSSVTLALAVGTLATGRRTEQCIAARRLKLFPASRAVAVIALIRSALAGSGSAGGASACLATGGPRAPMLVALVHRPSSRHARRRRRVQGEQRLAALAHRGELWSAICRHGDRSPPACARPAHRPRASLRIQRNSYRSLWRRGCGRAASFPDSLMMPDRLGRAGLRRARRGTMAVCAFLGFLDRALPSLPQLPKRDVKFLRVHRWQLGFIAKHVAELSKDAGSPLPSLFAGRVVRVEDHLQFFKLGVCQPAAVASLDDVTPSFKLHPECIVLIPQRGVLFFQSCHVGTSFRRAARL